MKTLSRDNLLLAALLLYGAFSSPTPETAGWAEILIGLCLCAVIGARCVFDLLTGRALFGENKTLAACFLILLFVPFVGGVLAQYNAGDMLRDLIPLGYFFLPLFLLPLARANPEKTTRALVWGLCAIGVLYSLRFWPSSHLTLGRFGLDRGDDEILYLSSSPAISFAGLYLFFTATDQHERNFMHRAGLLFLSAVCLLTFVAILQRGAIILVLLVIWFYTLGRVRQSLNGLMFFLLATMGGMLLAGDTVTDILQTIWRKTLLVGDNARFAELASVRDHLNHNKLQWLFGAGWGAKITTAASGHATVRYTHMLAGYVLLKAGLIGVVAMAVYLAGFFRQMHSAIRYYPGLAAAAFPSLLLGLTLYPSFKMLCFGAMLALIWTLPLRKEEHASERPPSFYQPRFSAR